MKILLATHFFHPSVGGLETVARVLADQLHARGHEVRVVTQSPAAPADAAPANPAATADATLFPYPVVRQPGRGDLWRLARWCDVFFQHNISLTTLWPLLTVRRPWVVALHMWLTRVDRSTGWQDRLKRALLRGGVVITVSRALAETLPVPATIIGNPYQDDLFRLLPDVPRTRDLVFLGRLVSDKGGDLLLAALVDLKDGGLTPKLTIIGDGPEREPLRAQAARLGVAGQVEFAGTLTGEALVRALNAHRVMVVPSRLPEPFGVVALEGLACGCVVVGSAAGGLADAIGLCGVTFPNDDRRALADALRRVLTDDDLCRRLRAETPAHLERHRPGPVAEAYLKVFEEAARQ